MSQVSEKKVIRIRCSAPKNPFYVRWLCPQGGWLYWCFERKQTYTCEVAEARVFQRYYSRIDVADSPVEVASKSSFQKVVLGADVIDHNDLALLNTMAAAIKVQHWLGDTKWITVIVQPGSFPLKETDLHAGSIELAAVFPQIAVQTQ